MSDVMKLAVERRSRVMTEIERLKEEVTRLNQFIRMGESLLAQASNRPDPDKPGDKPAEGEKKLEPVTGPGSAFTSPRVEAS